MLLLKRLDKKDKFGNYIYLFLCPVCKKEVEKQLSNGRRDKTCGCNLTPNFALNEGNRKLHECWTNMKTRCKNPNYIKAHRYAKRNITLYAEWERFLPFQEWALLNGYRPDLQIDRIDNNKGYYPENCRWVDNITNHRNSSTVKLSLTEVENIRLLHARGTTEKELSAQFKISRRQINNIVKLRQWL